MYQPFLHTDTNRAMMMLRVGAASDPRSMIKWIDQPSLVPFLQSVADDAKEQFRSWVIAHMIAETQQDDGSCFETFRRVNMFAKKQ